MNNVAYPPKTIPTPPSRRFWMFALALTGGIVYAILFQAINVRTPSGDKHWLAICFLGRPAAWILKTEYVPSGYSAEVLIMRVGSLAGVAVASWRVWFRVHRWVLMVLGAIYGSLLGSLISSIAETGYPATGILVSASALAVFFYFLPEGEHPALSEE